MSEPVEKSFVILVYLVLLLGTSLVFWQVRNFGFINYDDNDYVYENPHVLKGLSADNVIWAFTTSHSANWHPLTWLSLMLDCQLFGANPGWMHLENLLLHIANTLLLFAVFRKMSGALWPSVFVAAAFAIHPMHVESVAWIAERKDVLSTLFLLFTLAAYVSYVKHGSISRYVLTLLLFAMGLLVKPMLVTLPFLLLLLDYWPLERIGGQMTEDRKQKAKGAVRKLSAKQLIVEKIPFVALSIVSSVITFLAQLKGSAVAHIDALPLKARIANVFLSYARYMGRLFWPRNLAIFYPFDAGKVAFWQVAFCVLLLLVISILVIRLGRYRKYLPVGWFWFVGTLVPVIGLVQVGRQGFADRYTYIPYIGLFITLAWGLAEILSKWPWRKIALGSLMAISLTVFGILAYQQVSFWNDNFTLFSHAIEATQGNYIAYNNLGVAFDSAGLYQDAVENYKQTIRIDPDYPEAYFNIGVAYGRLDRLQDEIESYKHAIKIRPNYAKAYYNLGAAYRDLGRYEDSVEAGRQAVRIKPDYAEAYINLGVSYYKLGHYLDAIETYKRAIKIQPNIAEAHYALGIVYVVTGDKGAAIEEYKILKNLDAAKANELLKLIDKQALPNP